MNLANPRHLYDSTSDVVDRLSNTCVGFVDYWIRFDIADFFMTGEPAVIHKAIMSLVDRDDFEHIVLSDIIKSAEASVPHGV